MKTTDYVVADGHAITSKRGILGPGKTVKPEDVAGGKATLDRLAKAGYLTTAPEAVAVAPKADE